MSLLFEYLFSTSCRLFRLIGSLTQILGTIICSHLINMLKKEKRRRRKKKETIRTFFFTKTESPCSKLHITVSLGTIINYCQKCKLIKKWKINEQNEIAKDPSFKLRLCWLSFLSAIFQRELSLICELYCPLSHKKIGKPKAPPLQLASINNFLLIPKVRFSFFLCIFLCS